MGRYVVGIVGVFGAVPVWAHPGHGESGGWGLMHWLAEPAHAVPLALGVALVIGLALVRAGRSRG